MEGGSQERPLPLCYERNVKGPNPVQEERQLSAERAEDPAAGETPFHSQHTVRIPRPREPLPGDGPDARR